MIIDFCFHAPFCFYVCLSSILEPLDYQKDLFLGLLFSLVSIIAADLWFTIDLNDFSHYT